MASNISFDHVSMRTLVLGIIVGSLVAAIAIAVYANKGKLTSKADEYDPNSGDPYCRTLFDELFRLDTDNPEHQQLINDILTEAEGRNCQELLFKAYRARQGV